MPNVLGLVSFRVFPTHMGGQKGVALFYRYLQQHVTVLLAVSRDNVDTTIVSSERVLYPNKKIYRNFSRIRQLKSLILLHKTDVIICEHSYTGWLGWLLRKATNKPFIVHSHNIESKRFQQMGKWWWRIYHWYEKWIHRKAQHNFFISEDDRQFALKAFKLSPSCCTVITYGIEKRSLHQNKAVLRKELGLDVDKTIFLFNGTLDYEPNYEAVETLIDKLDSLLGNRLNNYEIVITGNRAPKALIEKILRTNNVTYTGYVDDVDQYYQAADVFINPVSNDTGVKTKLIEALANHCTAVSTDSGATGIEKEVCGDKLIVCRDHDWNGFADKILEALHKKESLTPLEFFEFYQWENIVKKAAEKISEVAGSKPGTQH